MIRLPKAAVDSLRNSARRIDGTLPIIAFAFDDTTEAYGFDAARLAKYLPTDSFTLTDDRYATDEPTLLMSLSSEQAAKEFSLLNEAFKIPVIVFAAADVIATWEG